MKGGGAGRSNNQIEDNVKRYVKVLTVPKH